MNSYKNEGLRPSEEARAQGVSVRTIYKWLRRFRAEGPAGLGNRSSRPFTCLHEYDQTVHQKVIQLRRERRTYRQISMTLKVGKSTMARILARGNNQLANQAPPTESV